MSALVSTLPRPFRTLVWAAAVTVVALTALVASPTADAEPAICSRVSPPPPRYCSGEDLPKLPPSVPKAPLPSDFAATGSTPNSVSLAWTDNAADEYSYTVSRSINGYWTLVGSLPANAGTGGRMTYTDTGLEADRSYTYRLEVSNPGGTSYGREYVTTSTVAVAVLSVGMRTTSTVDLRWSAASGATGYVVERSRQPSTAGSFTEVANLGADARGYTDRGLAHSTGYDYRVRATGGPVGFELSNVVSARTLGPQVRTVTLSPDQHVLSRYNGSVNFPTDAKILSVRNVAVGSDGRGVKMINVQHGGKTVGELAFDDTTHHFDGQSLQGPWDLELTATSMPWFWEGCHNPPAGNGCSPTGKVWLEVTWV